MTPTLAQGVLVWVVVSGLLVEVLASRGYLFVFFGPVWFHILNKRLGVVRGGGEREEGKTVVFVKHCSVGGSINS